MTTATPNPKIITALARASVFVEINNQETIKNVNLSDYDCLFMH